MHQKVSLRLMDGCGVKRMERGVVFQNFEVDVVYVWYESDLNWRQGETSNLLWGGGSVCLASDNEGEDKVHTFLTSAVISSARCPTSTLKISLEVAAGVSFGASTFGFLAGGRRFCLKSSRHHAQSVFQTSDPRSSPKICKMAWYK